LKICFWKQILWALKFGHITIIELKKRAQNCIGLSQVQFYAIETVFKFNPLTKKKNSSSSDRGQLYNYLWIFSIIFSFFAIWCYFYF